MNRTPSCPVLIAAFALVAAAPLAGQHYAVVDTSQFACYNNTQAIACPPPGQPFHGQDAQHAGASRSYVDHGDGTVSDLRTGLMWCKARVDDISWDDAVALAPFVNTGGYHDWRLPTIKELYSLIKFDGWCGTDPNSSSPFLDTAYFSFAYGVAPARFIDVQEWSNTEYVSTTMNGAATAFGVNFADGRIKGYPKTHPTGAPNLMRARYVRGQAHYGPNDLHDNGGGTVTDRATGLMWAKADSGAGLNWEAALAWVAAQNAAHYLGYNDWRMPNAKELQSIVDYTRAPGAGNPAQRGPAIDPLFTCTAIINEGNAADYPFYWASTTHLDGPAAVQATKAVYVAFGRALGWMNVPPGSPTWQLWDVHGAGAQRSDPKTGDPNNWPHGNGPQGDVVRIYNFVRCVRSVGAPGDLDCSGAVDFDDINPFVLALTDANAYAQSFPNCSRVLADVNQDAYVSFDDINPFVALLTRD